MKYYKVEINSAMEAVKQYYIDIKGGIDGYYEKTILDANIYAVEEGSIMAYFSVHEERGLTSLVVLPQYISKYTVIFNYVFDSSLFSKILFTENDKQFMENIREKGISYEYQAYNFEVDTKIHTEYIMKPVMNEDINLIKLKFNEFIDYNNIDLNKTKTFYYSDSEDLISFGAIEPLRLDPNRYCISMIVSDKYRNKGVGTETVKGKVTMVNGSKFIWIS